jgi:hypothetical protein
MKQLRLIPLIALFISGCRGCNDQADKEKITSDTSQTVITNGPDTTQKVTDTNNVSPSVPNSEAPEEKPSTNTTTSRDAALPKKDPGVLAKIDQYLVSVPKFTTTPTGGITQASITLTNKLSTASFQKAILEVTILKADNSVVSSNYYNVVNIEPGDSKQVNIPDSPQGSKIVVHVVKVRSNELTNGESVVTGVHYNMQ